MTSIRIEPATAVPWTDVEHAMTGGGDGATCWCQWFTMTGKEFDTMPKDEMRDRLRAELSSSEVSPALVAYVDDVAAGWVRVSPRFELSRLLRGKVVSGSVEPKEAQDVWAITCLIVRREFRGQGLMHNLVHAAVEHAVENGARVIEAYPFDTEKHLTSNNDLFVGSARLFAEHGFEEVARPTDARVVMSRNLMNEPRSPGLRDDYLGEAIIFASWDEFFANCTRFYELGVPYSLLGPDPDTLERLGPMPTPPWVTD